MKSMMKFAGACVMAMLAMGTIVAGAASAAGPLWLGCAEGGTATKYATNQCETAEAAGKWQLHEITGTEKVVMTGFTLTLRDSGISSAIRCDTGVEGEGAVGPGKKGRVTKFEVKEPEKNCARLEGPCESGEVTKVSGADLPWQLELYDTEGTVETNIEGTTAGKEPGWEIVCSTVLGKETDTCTTEEGLAESMSLARIQTPSNPSIGSGLRLLTLGRYFGLRKGKCSLGGGKTGEVSGHTAILLRNGGGLLVVAVS